MKREEFERLVTEAIGDLPAIFKARMENVVITVEDSPTAKQARRAGVSRGGLFMGLYEGVPLDRRTGHYSGAMPDKITIFRKNIEKTCASADEIKKGIIHVVGHELAHHFGISDKRLRKLGIY